MIDRNFSLFMGVPPLENSKRGQKWRTAGVIAVLPQFQYKLGEGRCQIKIGQRAVTDSEVRDLLCEIGLAMMLRRH